MRHFIMGFWLTIGVFVAATIASPPFVYVQHKLLGAWIKKSINDAQKEQQQQLKKLWGGGE